MIRTTDAMIKAVQVQKAKEALRNNIDARAKAIAAGANDLVPVFDEMISACRADVARAEEFLRNPAW